MSLENQYPEIHSALEDARKSDVDFYNDRYSGMVMRGLKKLADGYEELPTEILKNCEGLTSDTSTHLFFDWERVGELDPIMIPRRERDVEIQKDMKVISLCGPGHNEGWPTFLGRMFFNFLEGSLDLSDVQVQGLRDEIRNALSKLVFVQSQVFSLLRESDLMDEYMNADVDGDRKMRLYCDKELQIKDEVRALVRSVAPYMNFVFSSPELHITEAHIMGGVPIEEIPTA